MVLTQSFAVNNGFSGVFRVKATDMDVVVVISWFLMQFGKHVAIANFHHGI